MQAMIFSAQSPAALQKVRGRPLIVWHILNLVRAEVTDIILQHDDDSDMLEAALGDGTQFGARLRYYAAAPTPDHARRLPELFDSAPFIGITATVYCPHYPFASLFDALEESDLWGNPYPEHARDMAWISLVKNPSPETDGDFALTSFAVCNTGQPRHTFAGIGIYRPQIFHTVPVGQAINLPLLLQDLAHRAQVGGDLYRGDWANANNAAQCALLNRPFSAPAYPGQAS